ncbi:MAG: FAD binding domain-containing protein [Leptolyngbyaceae cyanobacterium]
MSIDRHAIIIGGALGGLFSGLLLRSVGWSVDIYERSAQPLNSRGGGIVMQPQVLEAFRRVGISLQDLGVVANERYYLDAQGNVTQRMGTRQTLTSWNRLYGLMQRQFPAEHYHLGKRLTDIQQTTDSVTAQYADGTSATGDLLIGADGPGSTVRSQLLPDSNYRYAGYVAYRGLVDEADLDPETAVLLTERFVFFQFPNSHILQYVIPGEDESLVPGERRFNWVWYVNYDETTELPRLLTDKDGKRRDYSIPPGLLAPSVEREMRAYADSVLAPPMQKLVAATQEPFVQAILDLDVPQMAFGRVVLLGDAAFIVRPHTAAGTSKAAANAIALADSLRIYDHDIDAALKAWEPGQLVDAQQLSHHGQFLGRQSQLTHGLGRLSTDQNRLFIK